MAKVLVLEGLRSGSPRPAPRSSASQARLERAATRAAMQADRALERARIMPSTAVAAFEAARAAALAIVVAENARARRASAGLGAVDWAQVGVEYDRQQAAIAAGTSPTAVYADFVARTGTCPAGTEARQKKSDGSFVCLTVGAELWDKLTAAQQAAFLALKDKGATDGQAAFVLGFTVGPLSGIGGFIQGAASVATGAGQAVIDAAGSVVDVATDLAKQAACYAAKVAADRAMADLGCGAPPFASAKCKAAAAVQSGLMKKIGCTPPAAYAAAVDPAAAASKGLGLKIAVGVGIPLVLALAMGGR